ncbi:MAG: DUF4249 family protein [Bacteroidota bacterium]|nr:DUF4249 family protein [Bacteroidota bacterium]
MQRRLLFLVLMVTLFVSCEDIYKPDLEIVPGIIVVESQVTNDLNQNYVILSKTTDFYNPMPQEKVTGARVELVQLSGFSYYPIETIYNSTEISPGHYIFKNPPVPGNNYRLRITMGPDVYESNLEQMPPLPVIDSLYTRFKLEKSYRTDTYGPPTLVKTPSQEIYIDAPITPLLQYYRFNWRTVLQWTNIPPSNGPSVPSFWGWLSRYQDGEFNLAGIKQFSTSNLVTKHPVLSLPYNLHDYLETDKQTGCGWILILDQYGISKDSHNFYENLNKQLSAEGNLFDPLLTQVFGNMRCKSDSSKIVFGNFNLNSYKQYRYFLYLGTNEKSKMILRKLNRYPDIPFRGVVQGIQPSFWETY